MSRIWRHPHSIRKFPVELENHCLQAEIKSDHRQISHFQNGRHKVTVEHVVYFDEVIYLRVWE